MNYRDISTIVQQQSVPTDIQTDVLKKAKAFINDGLEVEAVVSTNTITLDVYDEQGVRVDRINTTFSKMPVIQDDSDEEIINPEDVEITD
jgi:hypothetical protein